MLQSGWGSTHAPVLGDAGDGLRAHLDSTQAARIEEPDGDDTCALPNITLGIDMLAATGSFDPDAQTLDADFTRTFRVQGTLTNAGCGIGAVRVDVTLYVPVGYPIMDYPANCLYHLVDARE